MSKPALEVVRSVPVPLLLLFMLLGVLLWLLSQATVELVSYVRDGIFLMFNNLVDQESELLCLPNYVELWDLFLRRCFFVRSFFMWLSWSWRVRPLISYVL